MSMPAAPPFSRSEDGNRWNAHMRTKMEDCRHGAWEGAERYVKCAVMKKNEDCVWHLTIKQRFLADPSRPSMKRRGCVFEEGHDAEMNEPHMKLTTSGPRTRAGGTETKTHGGILKKKVKQELRDSLGNITFEKILQPTSAASSGSRTTNLTVPAWFIKAHGDKLQQSVVLRSAATQQQWTVRLGIYYPRNVAQVKFSAGWRAFATCNRLAHGDLLVFCLRHLSHFDVYIYRKADHAHEDVKEVKTETAVPPFKPSVNVELPCFYKSIVVSNLHNAAGYAIGAFLEIPHRFVVSHGKQLRQCVHLQGFVPGVPVRVVACKLTMQSRRTRLYLRTGWSSFVSDNQLWLGQVLVFTLTSNSSFLVQEALTSW